MRDVDEIYRILLNQNYQETLFSELDKVKSTATGYIACCPFHDDSHPSFSFSGEKPVWNCFGCGEKGDWIEYLQKRNQFDFIEALNHLAQAANFQIHNHKQSYSHWQKQADSRIKANEAFLKLQLNQSAMLFFQEQLLSDKGHEALEYLKQRGFLAEEVKGLGLGYFPGRLDTESFLRSQNFSTESIKQHIKWLEWRNDYKLVIPFKNQSGQILSLWGRLIRPLKDSEKEHDKYKPFSTDSSKAIPFNLNSIDDSAHAIVVEGFFDALTATQKGVPNVIACLGSSLSQAQVDHLNTLEIKSITLMLDNDDSGKKGTLRSIELLNKYSINGFVLKLPEQFKDPDEWFKSPTGSADCIVALDSKISAAKWQTQHLLSTHELSTPEGKRAALAEILAFEVTLHNPFDKEDCVTTYTQALDIAKEDIETLRLQILRDYELKQKQRHYDHFFKEGLKKLNSDELSDRWVKDQTERIQRQIELNVVQPYQLPVAMKDLQVNREGLETGFKSLDRLVRIPAEAITIVAGRPSHGKTTMMLNLFVNMVEQYPEKSFFFFSYEESKKRLFVKVINILSGIVLNRSLQAQNLRQLELYIRGNHNRYGEITESLNTYSTWSERRMWLIDERYFVEDLISQIAFLKEKYDIGAIFIDYIQKLKTREKASTRQLEVQKISEKILDASIRLSLPIILGAQLGRASGYADKVRLDNLREAGDIEQDSNLVLGIFNPSMEKQIDPVAELARTSDEPEREVDFEVHILKNRDGEVGGKVTLTFDRPVLKIKDMSIPF